MGAGGGSFFTGGRYLMHEKMFSLGQMMHGYNAQLSTPSSYQI